MIFLLRVDGVRGVVRLLRFLDLRYVCKLILSFFALISFTYSRANPSPPVSSTSLAHPATRTTAGDASNLPDVHPTAPAVHHAQSGPAALPSAPLPYSKSCAASIRIEMLCEGISYLLFQQLVGG